MNYSFVVVTAVVSGTSSLLMALAVRRVVYVFFPTFVCHILNVIYNVLNIKGRSLALSVVLEKKPS